MKLNFYSSWKTKVNFYENYCQCLWDHLIQISMLTRQHLRSWVIMKFESTNSRIDGTQLRSVSVDLRRSKHHFKRNFSIRNLVQNKISKFRIILTRNWGCNSVQVFYWNLIEHPTQRKYSKINIIFLDRYLYNIYVRDV